MRARMTGRRAVEATGAAFTLIELLIVVAIIAILAAIAVPNFLEAQTRAKVSRVQSDLRSLATAQEAYRVDWNTYTFKDQGDAPDGYVDGFTQLTSPIAYITSIPRDPFGAHRWPGNMSRRWDVFEMGTGNSGTRETSGFPDNPNPAGLPADVFMMCSAGPDHIDDTRSGGGGPRLTEGHFPWPNLVDADLPYVLALVYDPTNGTVSGGQVYRVGGNKPVGICYDALFRGSTQGK